MKRFLISTFFLSLLWCGDAAAAKIDTLEIYSPAMSRTVSVTAVVPDAATSERTCPVIYLLHGYSGDAFTWLKIKPTLPEIADMEGIAFVCPDGENSWYLDSPVNPKSMYETFISCELLPAVEKLLPVARERSARAIAGLSMGGFGAMSLAIKHKELFGAVGSMSGGLDIRPFSENWDLPLVLGEQAEHSANWEAVTPINLISRIEEGELAIVFDCGYGDFFLDVNQAFHKELLRRGISHDFYVRPGHHDNIYWSNAVDYQLLFFRKFFDRTK